MTTHPVPAATNDHHRALLHRAVTGPVTPLVMSEVAARAIGRGLAEGRCDRCAPEPASDPGRRVELSAREREILIAWLHTDSKEAVAASLYLTPSTVRTYLQRVRAKYDRAGRPARTKAALAARAIQDGYIDINEL